MKQVKVCHKCPLLVICDLQGSKFYQYTGGKNVAAFVANMYLLVKMEKWHEITDVVY